MTFAVESTPAASQVCVAVAGEVDVETAPRMRAALEDARRSALPVVVDLGAVTFMDSAGFSVLASAHRIAEAGGSSLRLRAVPPRIRRLLAILGLDGVLTIEPVRSDDVPT